jgi:hypothetical protein
LIGHSILLYTSIKIAVLINFLYNVRKRGRPKQYFIASNSTRESEKEALDLLKERGVIDDYEYNIANHYKQLFIIRNGLPRICAYELAKVNGKNIITSKRYEKYCNTLYKLITDALKKSGHLSIILDICVYESRKRFAVSELPFIKDAIAELVRLSEAF